LQDVGDTFVDTPTLLADSDVVTTPKLTTWSMPLPADRCRPISPSGWSRSVSNSSRRYREWSPCPRHRSASGHPHHPAERRRWLPRHRRRTGTRASRW